MKTGDISLKDAKEIVANAEGFTTDGDTVKFTLEPDVDLSSKVSPSTVDTVINDPALIDKAGSEFYMKQRGVGLGQNVDNLIAMQGGTNADILDKTNRHAVNMALITPGARLLSALAYKNLIG